MSRFDDNRVELYESGLNDYEIAERVDVTRSAISAWRNRNELPPNGQKTSQVGSGRSIDDNRLNLYESGLKDHEIAESVGVSRASIAQWRQRRGLESNSQHGKSFEERFEEKFEKNSSDSCWEWGASKDACGYGTMYYNGGVERSHRISWEIENGAIPDDGFVLHHCDNPSCVNPSHLYIGDQYDNMRDMVERDRHKPMYGSENPMSKFQEEDIMQMRNLHPEMSCGELADKYSTTVSNVRRIIDGEAWPHVGGGE